MKPEQLRSYGVGSLLIDCLLFVDAIIDICTGKFTMDDLLTLLSINLLLAIPLIILIKKKMTKRRKPSKLRSTEEQENICNIEEPE